MKNPIKEAYYSQKASAKRRKIPFKFSFEQWIKWWEINLGLDWFNRRGRKRGQYVMARKGDKGSYIVENVECVLTSINHSSKKPTNVVLSRTDVKNIFLSKEPYSKITAKYQYSKGTISLIKNGKLWKSVTKELKA